VTSTSMSTSTGPDRERSERAQRRRQRVGDFISRDEENKNQRSRFHVVTFSLLSKRLGASALETCEYHRNSR
jgi:hypothetical protein